MEYFLFIIWIAIMFTLGYTVLMARKSLKKISGKGLK